MTTWTVLQNLFGNPQVTAIKILTCTNARNGFLTTYFFLQTNNVLADPLLLLGEVNQVMSDTLSLFAQSFLQFFVLQQRKLSLVLHISYICYQFRSSMHQIDMDCPGCIHFFSFSKKSYIKEIKGV